MRGRTNVSGGGNVINAKTEEFEVAPNEQVASGNMVDIWSELKGAISLTNTSSPRKMFTLSDGRLLCIVGKTAYVVQINNGVYSISLTLQNSFNASSPSYEVSPDNYIVFGTELIQDEESVSWCYVSLSCKLYTYDILTDSFSYTTLISSYKIPELHCAKKTGTGVYEAYGSWISEGKFDLELEEKYLFLSVATANLCYTNNDSFTPPIRSYNAKLIKIAFEISNTNGNYSANIIQHGVIADESPNSSGTRSIDIAMPEIVKLEDGHAIFYGFSYRTVSTEEEITTTRFSKNDMLIYSSFENYSECTKTTVSSPNMAITPIGYGNGILTYISVASSSATASVPTKGIYKRNVRLFNFKDNDASKTFYNAEMIFNTPRLSDEKGDKRIIITSFSIKENESETRRTCLIFFTSDPYETTETLSSNYVFIAEYDSLTNYFAIVDNSKWERDRYSVQTRIDSKNNIIVFSKMLVSGKTLMHSLGTYYIDISDMSFGSRQELKKYVKNATNLKYIRGIAKQSGNSGDVIEVYVPKL